MAVVRREQAMVTAETAVVVPFIVATAVGLAQMVALAAAHAQLSDAAREGARVLARGESTGAARAVVEKSVPGVSFRVSRADGRVRVRLERSMSVAMLAGADIDLAASAEAAVE